MPVAACDSIFPRTQIRPASPLLVLRCCPSPRVLERDPASRGVGTPVPKTGGLQPAARSCSSLCSPRAPCWCVWQKRPPGLSCEVQIPRSPQSQEPPRGEASPLRPALVWLAREEHALSGAPELCPVTSSPASLWVWSIVWTTRFMKEASDHVVFFFADFSKGLSNLVYLVQRLNEAI